MVDNYHTHKHPEIGAWLAKNPRIALHFTPTSGSWLNLVEVFFGIITRQAIRRGSFHSVTQLITAIRAFTAGWNDRCPPYLDQDSRRVPAPRHPSTNLRRGTLDALEVRSRAQPKASRASSIRSRRTVAGFIHNDSGFDQRRPHDLAVHAHPAAVRKA